MAQDPFGDIPLFREIQRLLASSAGPVNLEIARQIATAVARGEGDPPVAPELTRMFARAVHESTGVVAGYTRLSPEEPFATRMPSRVGWAHETLRAWAWLLERVAQRFTAEMGRLAGGEGNAAPFQQAFAGVAPLLLGIQTGTVVGHLAREVLARYDLPVPRDDDGRLFLVGANVEQVASDYGFDPPTFVQWITLREVTRSLVLTQVPWVASYLRSLLTDVVEAIEIDPGDIEQRFMELQARGMQTLEGGIDSETALPIAQTARHRAALDRLHAFLATFQGYADHTANAVGNAVLGDTTIIDEGVSRHQVSPSEGKTMLAAVLGLRLDRKLEAAGKTFCAAVVKLHGIHVLGKLWEAADNLPSTEEIKDPFVWMERVLA